MRNTLVIVTYSLIAYGAMFSLATLFWWVYPYPTNATQEQINFAWSVHIISEKFLGYALVAILAAVVTLKSRNISGKLSIFYGVLSGISYEIIASVIYIVRFGIEPYIENSHPEELAAIVITLCAVISSLVYWYMPYKHPSRRQKAARLNFNVIRNRKSSETIKRSALGALIY